MVFVKQGSCNCDLQKPNGTLMAVIPNQMNVVVTWPVESSPIKKVNSSQLIFLGVLGESTVPLLPRVSHFLSISAIWSRSAADPTLYPTSSELLLTAQLQSSPSLPQCHCRYLAFGDYMRFPYKVLTVRWSSVALKEPTGLFRAVVYHRAMGDTLVSLGCVFLWQCIWLYFGRIA